MTVQYLVGDVRKIIADIPDGSVDFLTSSPPFLALRSYLPAGHASKGDEIGSEANPAAFLDTLLALTAEWGRVLAPHGSLAIELGDTYSGSGGAGGDYNDGGVREDAPKFSGSAMSYRKTAQRNRDLNAWPLAKSLALIPQLYAVALAYGINPLNGQRSPAGRWRVRNIIVWHRPNPAVGALGDKVRPSTSYITVATRSGKRWFDLTAVRTPYAENTINNGKVMREGVADNGPRTHMAERKLTHAGAPPLDAWFDEWDGTHDTWTMTTQPSALAHYAMWPAKLAERLILMMCPREVCRECGEPRRRIERTTNAVGKRPPVSLTAKKKQLPDALVHIDLNGGPDCSERETIGWSDCGCLCYSCRNGGCSVCTHNYRPGLVLDPFAGTFTTGLAAEFHGRDSIGIDLDPRNADLVPARREEVRRALNPTHVRVINGQGDLFAEAL